jgi:hypothetical protein
MDVNRSMVVAALVAAGFRDPDQIREACANIMLLAGSEEEEEEDKDEESENA